MGSILWVLISSLTFVGCKPTQFSGKNNRTNAASAKSDTDPLPQNSPNAQNSEATKFYEIPVFRVCKYGGTAGLNSWSFKGLRKLTKIYAKFYKVQMFGDQKGLSRENPLLPSTPPETIYKQSQDEGLIRVEGIPAGDYGVLICELDKKGCGNPNKYESPLDNLFKSEISTPAFVTLTSGGKVTGRIEVMQDMSLGKSDDPHCDKHSYTFP